MAIAIVADMEPEELRRTAGLAQLSLSDEELAALAAAAEEVLEFFAVLQEVDVHEGEAEEAVSSTLLRADCVSQRLSPDELLDAAPEVEDRLILIPNVL
ncbi:MAG: Asp-tRNA(Asn)/Glu-tRNA(Gln) amidotransferase subunit GatC [bacterium]